MVCPILPVSGPLPETTFLSVSNIVGKTLPYMRLVRSGILDHWLKLDTFLHERTLGISEFLAFRLFAMPVIF